MKNKKVIVAFVLILAAFTVGIFTFNAKKDVSVDAVSEYRHGLTEHMINQGMYRCCLEKPCATCLELTPWHGEGLECDCLSDLVNGQAPCGECVGGILAGRGNKYLAEYFARSIAEEVGEEHLAMLKEIISEKYGIPAEQQL